MLIFQQNTKKKIHQRKLTRNSTFFAIIIIFHSTKWLKFREKSNIFTVCVCVYVMKSNRTSKISVRERGNSDPSMGTNKKAEKGIKIQTNECE